MSDIDEIIAGGGLVFKGAPKGDPNAGKEKEVYHWSTWQRVG